MLMLILGSLLLGRIEREAPAKKGTGALGGHNPKKRAKPKVELAASQTQQKVSQKTIDSMKSMGMQKAIEKANSGKASPEFVEGAKRMYGNRVKPVVSTSPVVSKSAKPPAKLDPKPSPSIAAQRVDKANRKKGNVTGKGRATGLR